MHLVARLTLKKKKLYHIYKKSQKKIINLIFTSSGVNQANIILAITSEEIINLATKEVVQNTENIKDACNLAN